jgi:hypothetical protein
MSKLLFPDDAFGDRFDLNTLPLPRKASGYAVQRLGTDTLLDRSGGGFLSVRAHQLQALFATFDAAHAAASEWLIGHSGTAQEHDLAIVPANFDQRLQRHVLIYGVLCAHP